MRQARGVQVVRDERDPETVRRILAGDWEWAAYALCDLEPPHFEHSRYLVTAEGAAVVLVYRTDSFTSLIPCGEPEGVERIFAAADALPESSFLQTRRQDMPAIESRYALREPIDMLRMTARTHDVRPQNRVASIRLLGPTDLEAVADLYALWPESVFSPRALVSGTYAGAWVGTELVAVAGTHAVSPASRLAIIGNVFTRPDMRGRGLASALMFTLVAALRSQGIERLALNVVASNSAATTVYTRLGFVVHRPFLEGRVSLLKSTR